VSTVKKSQASRSSIIAATEGLGDDLGIDC
jgi:hypothetical protein